MSKVVALVDIHPGGHHLMYLKLFTKTVLDKGYAVQVYTPEANELTEWVKANVENAEGRFWTAEVYRPTTIQFPIRKLMGLIDRLYLWRSLTIAIKKLSKESGTTPEFVFIAWLEDFFHPVPKFTHRLIPLIFPYKWGGLTFQYMAYELGILPVSRLASGPDEIMSLPNARAITTLDETLVPVMQERLSGKTVLALPDFTINTYDPNYSDATLEKIKQLAKGRKIISLVGAIEKRKGLLELIEMAEQTRNRDWFYVVAGKFYPHFEMKELTHIVNTISRYPENMCFAFEFIPDPTFDGIMAMSDLVFAVYRDFPFSSNLLIKAANFDKPILVSNEYLMADRVNRFQTGSAVEPGEIAQYIAAAERELASDTRRPVENFAAYRNEHSLERLSEVFDDILAAGLS